ncbi:Uncharacterized protein BP5553_03969 [Venustampulla echinocandica]|uniref:Zn(2)-C6 fungal-type domain-containing protein n=1 Tax=Venustampulla echinocandica TaxID=2656787 RepID=A0A370TVT7_9HELO|nr:Uncharacterized protein BP5553_03969 [Venustampulla echinocandica]RDL39629.1 Uncharacterized protein BP5553_03969 [Venustampulla echinocandica]
MSSTISSATAATVPPTPKQIRFVNNEGQPPAKRRRINAACRTCRKRKTRCDGKRPLCSTCTENGHECLGYAEIGEAHISKKEHKDSDSMRNGEEDPEVEDEDKAGHSTSSPENERRSMTHGSPDLRRINSNPQSYLDARRSPHEGIRNMLEKGSAMNFGNDYRESAVYSEEGSTPMDLPRPPRTDNHRVPYFRYFGPTAIVPGFKQMVVSVREHRRSTGAGSAVAMSPGAASYGGGSGSGHGGASSLAGSETRHSVDMPIYDRDDPLPVNRLIIHLVETFFTHLGCNYPFLRRRPFIQCVEDRSAEAILVDAVCALGARFSDHPLLIGSHDPSYPKSDYGNVFAQRAKAAVVDQFPCPTVAATQACLLLAYESFGANQDSALWMYLGCAIRMAVDLGLQKLDGVKHQGEKDPRSYSQSNDSGPSEPTSISAQEKKEVEQERIDTLWAVFMLDRVISSGTGRPATLRDEDFELAFPAVTNNSESDWPNPFPTLIQIIHLYGRVSDLLNNIRNVQDVTPKKIEGLAGMEKDLTEIYQRLDQRLTFNAPNFQHYVKSGEGTNFILLHFWFHTLIMLLHQPTLMHSFEGQILQLLPNSRELSMSSAKTIADILAFAELIDPRSFIGNPFTSQPMYIAACAFLMESAVHSSQPTSREISPPGHVLKKMISKDLKGDRTDAKEQKKHSLLASAANQNYQRCYKALQQLEVYWAGTRYILVALDQKAKGIWDPETFTEQEYESTKVKHDMIPNWQTKLSLAAPSPAQLADLLPPRIEQAQGSPQISHTQAIGWSLTGTTNSPSSNLTFMYPSMNGEQSQPSQPRPAPPSQPAAGNMIYDPIRQSLPEATAAPTTTVTYPPRYQSYSTQARQNMPPPAPRFPSVASDGTTTSDAEMLLGLQNSAYASPHTPSSHYPYDPTQNVTSPTSTRHDPVTTPYDFSQNNDGMFGMHGDMGLGGMGDVMMESQDIDMSALGGDMMPWLEYLPQDVLNFFDSGNNAPITGPGPLNENMDIGTITTVEAKFESID